MTLEDDWIRQALAALRERGVRTIDQLSDEAQASLYACAIKLWPVIGTPSPIETLVEAGIRSEESVRQFAGELSLGMDLGPDEIREVGSYLRALRQAEQKRRNDLITHSRRCTCGLLRGVHPLFGEIWRRDEGGWMAGCACGEFPGTNAPSYREALADVYEDHLAVAETCPCPCHEDEEAQQLN
ncbi:MAG: hypothetical protein M3360_10945 [Actinomycetota bacterium]|nr:hypothetical protein [Actinomycetota bacterium]